MSKQIFCPYIKYTEQGWEAIILHFWQHNQYVACCGLTLIDPKKFINFKWFIVTTLLFLDLCSLHLLKIKKSFRAPYKLKAPLRVPSPPRSPPFPPQFLAFTLIHRFFLIPTLIPLILVIPLIPFPNSPFRFLQIPSVTFTFDITRKICTIEIDFFSFIVGFVLYMIIKRNYISITTATGNLKFRKFKSGGYKREVLITPSG